MNQWAGLLNLSPSFWLLVETQSSSQQSICLSPSFLVFFRHSSTSTVRVILIRFGPFTPESRSPITALVLVTPFAQTSLFSLLRADAQLVTSTSSQICRPRANRLESIAARFSLYQMQIKEQKKRIGPKMNPDHHPPEFDLVQNQWFCLAFRSCKEAEVRWPASEQASWTAKSSTRIAVIFIRYIYNCNWVRNGFFVNIQACAHRHEHDHRWIITLQLKESSQRVDKRLKINVEMIKLQSKIVLSKRLAQPLRNVLEVDVNVLPLQFLHVSHHLSVQVLQATDLFLCDSGLGIEEDGLNGVELK